MSFRKVNWDGFKLGGHYQKARVSFAPPKKQDRRDNAQEVRISNAISKSLKSKRKNEELFASLSEERQQAILKALVST